MNKHLVFFFKSYSKNRAQKNQNSYMFNFIEKQRIIQDLFLSKLYCISIQLINGWMKTRMYLQYSRYLHVKKFNKQFFMILILDYDYP